MTRKRNFSRNINRNTQITKTKNFIIQKKIQGKYMTAFTTQILNQPVKFTKKEANQLIKKLPRDLLTDEPLYRIKKV